MKILFIGNSFSQDACAYMSKIAAAGNFDLTTVNLFIGGCSLERHCSNIGVFDEEHSYVKYINAVECETRISLEDALKEDVYDFVSVQQASSFSGIWESYVPHLETLVSLVRKYQPTAKIIVHETWAYEYNFERDAFLKYENNRHLMHKRLTECYHRAAELISADLFIPTGELIAALRESEVFDPERGGTALTRDGFHLGLDYGRYAIAALWCVKLGMTELSDNTFIPTVEGIEKEKIELIKKTILDRFS